MKKITAVIVCLTLAMTSTAAFALDYSEGDKMVGDTFLARPVGIVATAVGIAVFVVSLPFSILSGSVDRAAQGLIADPAEFTFARPLGDFNPYDDDRYEECKEGYDPITGAHRCE